MSRVLKRPMFKMGGSTNGGITSGLKRARYVEGKRVTTEDVLKEYGPAPRSSNVYDFLIDFGLNIASMPPQGNIISTAAAAARDPFSRFQEGKSKGDQLAYAMRAQAADAASKRNLAYDEMKNKKEIAAMSLAHHKRYGVMSPRPEYELKQSNVLKDNKNIWDKQFSKNRGKWEGSVYFDKFQHKKGNIINAADTGKIVQKDQEFLVDLTKFTEGDETKIFWDDTSGEWFTVTFNEKDNKWEIDKQMPMVISDETEEYTDYSLKELQNYLENKKEARQIQSMDEGTSDENDLTSLVEGNKLEEGMIHPTVDGTADGEILDEYLIQYAEDNKKILYEPETRAEAIVKFKELGGSKAGYELVAKLFYKNFLKRENKKGRRSANIKKVGIKSQEKEAFKWYDKWWDRYQAGTITVPERFKKHLDAYQIQKAEKQEKTAAKS